MEATEPMTTEQAAASLVMPDDQSEEETETVSEDPPESEEIEDETAEQDDPDGDEADASEDTEDDDETDEDDDQEDESPAKLHTVKVDGEEKRVPYDELVRGYAGQSYVQKGMAQNAEFAKSLQAERQAVLQAFQAMQSGPMLQAPQPPDDSMIDHDPIGFMQDQARYQRQLDQYQQQSQQMQYLHSQEQAQNQRAQQEQIAAERKKMLEMIPDLQDPEKGPKVIKQLMTAAESYGFSQKDLEGITDSRAVAILNDAARYRALKSSTVKGHSKVEGARPVLKPGAKKTTSNKATEAARKNRAIQTQRPEDWAATLLIKR